MTNNARDTIGTRIKRLEIALVFAGLAVVGGLLVEEWSELNAAHRERRWPNRETIGNIVVTLGVASEVIIATLIARLSRRSDEIADREIAESNERAAQANERAARAEESLAKLRSPRAMTFDLDKCVSLLRARNVVANAEVLYQPEDAEAAFFALVLRAVLRSAGWNVADPIPAPSVAPGVMPAIVMAGGNFSGVALLTREISDDSPADILGEALRQCGVLSSGWKSDANIAEGNVRLVVGPKV